MWNDRRGREVEKRKTGLEKGRELYMRLDCSPSAARLLELEEDVVEILMVVTVDMVPSVLDKVNVDF